MRCCSIWVNVILRKKTRGIEWSHSAAYYPVHKLCIYIYVAHGAVCLLWHRKLLGLGLAAPQLSMGSFSGHKPLCLSGHSAPSVGRGQKGIMSIFKSVVVVLLRKKLKISVLGDSNIFFLILHLSSLLTSWYLLLILETESGCFELVTQPQTA